MEKDKDGNLTYRISQRDGVALNEYKSAKKQSKFDWEILEGDNKFQTFIEISEEESDNKDGITAEEVLINIAKIWKEADIRFGAKTTRGFGKICNVEIIRKSFNFLKNREDEKEASIEDWLDFDVFDKDSWKNSISYNKMTESLEENKEKGSIREWIIKKKNVLSLKLRLEGGISIRRYSTQCSDEDSSPDQEQMTTIKLKDEKSIEEVAVIPGTTWAGAIGHRMEELIKNSKIVEFKSDDNAIQIYHYFGAANDNDKEKSLICFGESKLTGGEFKTISRNAIDRFLGSTAEGALFTEKIYIGGETTLEIGFLDPYNTAVSYTEKFIMALAAALTDLHEGYLAIGGATSVGRGIFSITHINEKELDIVKAENEIKAENNSIVFDKLYNTLKTLIGKKEAEDGKHTSQT